MDNITHPYAMACSASSGLLYVCQPRSHQIVVMDHAARQVGCFGNNLLHIPCGVAVDTCWTHGQQQDVLYVVDCSLVPRVFVLSSNGSLIRCFGKQFLSSPSGIAVDSDRVYVTDRAANKVLVFSKTGKLLTQFGQEGLEPGQLKLPTTIAVCPSTGLVYVADRVGCRISLFDVLGNYKGQFNPNPKPPQAKGKPSPLSFCLSTSGDKVYILDAASHSVSMYWANGSLIRSFGDQGSGYCQFNWPMAIAQDASSCLYVADIKNNRICLFV